MVPVCLSASADIGMLSPFWLSATPERLMEEAIFHHGACDDGDIDPRDLAWQLVLDLPTDLLVPLMDGRNGRQEWLDAEIAMHDADATGYADMYRCLLDEPLDTPSSFHSRAIEFRYGMAGTGRLRGS